MYIAYAPPPPLSRPRQILFLGDAPLPRPTEKDTSTKRGCPLFFGGCPLSRLTAPAAPRMGCVEALAGCPLSHGCRRASVSAAASVGRWATSHRDVAAPKGEPSMCATKSLRKAKSRLPLWGRWTRVSEDGGGQVPASQPSFREAPFSALRRPGKALRCFPSFSLADAHKVKGKVEAFLKKSFTKKLYARFARPPARTCVFLLHRRGVQPPPQGAN